MRILLCLFALLGTGLMLPGMAEACGGAKDRCAVEGGYYLAAPPPDWDGESPLATVVYFHGWNGSPEGTFRNKAMVSGVHKRGAMFVAPYAPNGYWRQIGEGRAESGRDEEAFVRAVMKDLKARWPVDEDRVLASGFSRGASMVWNLACFVGDQFAGFAPIAGGFWHSTPKSCRSGPVNLRHIHGKADRVVAFDEVGVYNSMPIWEGFDIFMNLNRAAGEPVTHYETRRLKCTRWGVAPTGKTLEMCTHPRGHSIPAEWVAEGLDWLDDVRR